MYKTWSRWFTYSAEKL